MVTFKALVLAHHKRQDGTYPVKIRVTYKGKSKFLSTNLTATSADLTRSLKIKSPDMLNKTEGLIKDMRESIKNISPFELESRDVDWVVDYIKNKLTGENFRLDFFEWADKFLGTKVDSTRRVYEGSLNAFERFLGKREIDINSITKRMLLDFVEHINQEPKMYYSKKYGKVLESKVQKTSKGAGARHIINLQHIYNAAKAKYNDEDEDRILIPRSPFDTIDKATPTSKGQDNLGVELMQRIISAKTDNPTIRIALDAFIVSFGLMGANMADLYPATPQGSMWDYCRAKTKGRRADRARMKVNVPSVIIPYLERLQDGTRDYWLPKLHKIANSKDHCTGAVNRYLKKWAESEGIPVFTFYAARHSWASIGRSLGIEKATIDDCLVHKGDFEVADIYAERAWSVMQEANDRILGQFKWE